MFTLYYIEDGKTKSKNFNTVADYEAWKKMHPAIQELAKTW